MAGASSPRASRGRAGKELHNSADREFYFHNEMTQLFGFPLYFSHPSPLDLNLRSISVVISEEKTVTYG
ncbi:hypothetical protein EVAR_73564_1 [Eumeta japonica]|uniref:Uncharacterized protein n=1 Tax=Eumeta variegata TaxID=151549 RepID=A0A4C1SQB0_EUMVA|nr:hypothetical protein EVAR_73564_1 [Eumeta japonica]